MIEGKNTVRPGVSGVVLGTVLLILVASGQPGSSGEGRAQKSILDNGLTVILDIDDTSPTTILQILVRGGKRAEPAGKKGLSFLTTRLSVEIPDSGKVQELMSLATRFSVTSLGDLSLINIECLSENLEASLKVLAKIILDPLFSGLRIDAVKRHMEHQGQVEEDDSVRLGHLVALGTLFTGTPYEGSIYGDKESLKAIKSRDVSDYYKRYFCGQNMIISISSDLPEKTLLEMLGEHFSKIPKGEPVSFDPVLASEPEEQSVSIERDTKQTYICLAYPLPQVSAPKKGWPTTWTAGPPRCSPVV
jgi:zinc protease